MIICASIYMYGRLHGLVEGVIYGIHKEEGEGGVYAWSGGDMNIIAREKQSRKTVKGG